MKISKLNITGPLSRESTNDKGPIMPKAFPRFEVMGIYLERDWFYHNTRDLWLMQYSKMTCIDQNIFSSLNYVHYTKYYTCSDLVFFSHRWSYYRFFLIWDDPIDIFQINIFYLTLYYLRTEVLRTFDLWSISIEISSEPDKSTIKFESNKDIHGLRESDIQKGWILITSFHHLMGQISIQFSHWAPVKCTAFLQLYLPRKICVFK